MFKTLSLLAILSLSSQLMAVVGDETPVALPSKADAIVKASTKKLNDLQIQMNKIYIDESAQLEKVKVEFAKKGDLDSANAIAAKIKEVNALIVDPVGKSLINGNDQIIGKWKYSKPGWSIEITFKEGGIFTSTAGSGTWVKKMNKVVFTLDSNSNWWNTINDPSSDESKGDSWDHGANTATAKRIK